MIHSIRRLLNKFIYEFIYECIKSQQIHDFLTLVFIKLPFMF